MSRLKMKQDTSLRKVGGKLLHLSREVYREPTQAFDRAHGTEIEGEFCGLFEGNLRTETVDAEPNQDGHIDGTTLRFHYDRTYQWDENGTTKTHHIVNVMVPDLDGKEESGMKGVESIARTEDPKQFKLDDFAAEALGMVTILSCGG